MKVYIVARPYKEIEEFIPMYITTYEDKARIFHKMFSDESIMLVIFSKEWNPDDRKGSPNILFNYLDGYLRCPQFLENKNTLYGKYKEWMEQDLKELEKYTVGYPNECGIKYVKIWDLDDEK